MAIMRIISQRYLDRYVPGDEIPVDAYPAETIDKWEKAGKILVFNAPEPAAKPATRKRAAAKKAK